MLSIWLMCIKCLILCTLKRSVLKVLSVQLEGDGSAYRDVLIECNVIPALLARISPDTPVSDKSETPKASFPFYMKHSFDLQGLYLNYT